MIRAHDLLAAEVAGCSAKVRAKTESESTSSGSAFTRCRESGGACEDAAWARGRLVAEPPAAKIWGLTMSLHWYTHVALRVERLREAEAFYRGRFALEVAFREAETPEGCALPGRFTPCA
jgi:hypothetical protein